MIPLDRKKWIKIRKNITNREEKEKAINQSLTPFLKGKIGLYATIQGEVDLLRFHLKEGIYLPRVLDSTSMEFYEYTGEFQEGPFHVLEPTGNLIDSMDLDVIVVPMVSFHNCIRMGFGKGYYDRYLSKTKALKIGVAFDEQENKELVCKEFDIDMDMVITPTRRIVK